MSLLDAFFNKGFNGAKCKTLLKLTIPRIKLLRNRREVQLKHMRRDIAKLLETGQEATARIRVEHIIREESMMAAQEVVELFCELIVVRLPIIETQKECPLDLKEAISSVCFAAPRCSDLPELQQVQMLFASKYGREFVSAAAELLPDCGVNRQIIELLSVRAPSPEVKLKLLKEIAEEHDLDWDPSASETEFLKPREDLLNGPTQLGPTQLDPTPLIGMSKLPSSIEKSLLSSPVQASQEQVDSDDAFDSLDFPEVPKVSLKPNRDLGSAPVVVSETPTSPDLESDNEITRSARGNESIPYEYSSESDKAVSDDPIPDLPSSNISVGTREDKQFLPFISSPSFSSASFAVKERERPKFGSTFPSTRSEADLDLEDVLAAAQAAAVSAEQAAAAARSAASLTQLRISELVQKRNDQVVLESRECTYQMDDSNRPTLPKTPTFDRGNSFGDNMNDSHSLDKELSGGPMTPKATYLDTHEVNSDVVPGSKEQLGCHPTHQPQRSSSLEDDPYFSYPNLFKSSDTKP